MKKMLIVLSLIMSFGAVASESIAHYRFAQSVGTPGSVGIPFGGSWRVVEVSLKEDGLLSVKETITRPFPNAGTPARVEEVVLNESAFELLKYDAITLANAKIEQRIAQIVCMMMPSPAQSNDHLSVVSKHDYRDGFSGELRLVDGPGGCWVRNHVHPKGVHAVNAAKLLKRSLKLKALEVLGL